MLALDVLEGRKTNQRRDHNQRDQMIWRLGDIGRANQGWPPRR